VRWTPALVVLLILAVATAGSEPSLSWRLTQLNAKIAEHRREIERLEQEKRRLLDVPDSPPEVGPESRLYTGPRNGRYYINAKGRKVYQRKLPPDH
jgi:hypothetical protein